MISETALAALVWGSVVLVAVLFGYEALALLGERQK
jgi:hypothetical protein